MCTYENCMQSETVLKIRSSLIIATVVIKERKTRPHSYCIKEGAQFNSNTIRFQQFSSLLLQGDQVSIKCKQIKAEEEGLRKQLHFNLSTKA